MVIILICHAGIEKPLHTGFIHVTDATGFDEINVNCEGRISVTSPVTVAVPLFAKVIWYVTKSQDLDTFPLSGETIVFVNVRDQNPTIIHVTDADALLHTTGDWHVKIALFVYTVFAM